MTEETGAQEAMPHPAPEAAQGPTPAQAVKLLEQQLLRIKAERERACYEEVKAVLKKHGCRLAPTVVPAIRPDGALALGVTLDLHFDPDLMQ